MVDCWTKLRQAVASRAGNLSNRDRYRAISALAIETAQVSLELWRDTMGEHLRSAWAS